MSQLAKAYIVECLWHPSLTEIRNQENENMD